MIKIVVTCYSCRQNIPTGKSANDRVQFLIKYGKLNSVRCPHCSFIMTYGPNQTKKLISRYAKLLLLLVYIVLGVAVFAIVQNYITHVSADMPSRYLAYITPFVIYSLVVLFANKSMEDTMFRYNFYRVR